MSTFKAMNSTIKMAGVDPSLEVKLQNLFIDFEKAASRFIPDNALAYINGASLHVPIRVEEILADLLEKSLSLSRKAHYYVNPFLGDCMKSIGYANSFQPEFTPVILGRNDFSDPSVEEPVEQISKQWIIKKRPFTFDFGGFGKGYIVDQAKKLLLQEKTEQAVINAGGDLTVIGRQQVGIENPISIGSDMMRFFIRDCALATSAKNYRKWGHEEKQVHHILNGRTGNVAHNGVMQASVIAGTAMVAETVSKLFCILPFEEAKKLIKIRFPRIAYFVYFNDHRIAVGGDSSLYEDLEVAQ